MGDLEQIGTTARRDARREQLRIDVVLHVAHEQEAARAVAQVQDHGGVVDDTTVVRGTLGDGPTPGPPGDRDRVIDADLVARRQAAAEAAIGAQPFPERDITGSGAQHPILRHAPDVIALQQQGEAGHVVLVRMGEHDQVQAAVPWRQS